MLQFTSVTRPRLRLCVLSTTKILKRGLAFREIVDENGRLQCAGVNRHEAEEEESLRERTSEPLGPEFCTGHREVLGEA
jgi:hypothetical protein